MLYTHNVTAYNQLPWSRVPQFHPESQTQTASYMMLKYNPQSQTQAMTASYVKGNYHPQSSILTASYIKKNCSQDQFAMPLMMMSFG